MLKIHGGAGAWRMTPKQRRFAEEYIVDLNATRAALRAGYSKGCAHTHGWKILRRPDVAAFVADAQAARAARAGLTADRVVNELTKVAFGDPRRVFAWGPDGLALRESAGLSGAEAAQVSEISQTRTAAGVTTQHIKLHGKVPALMALAKHLGLLAGPRKPPAGQEGAKGEDHDDDDDDDGGEDPREILARRIAVIAERLRANRDPGGGEPG